MKYKIEALVEAKNTKPEEDIMLCPICGENPAEPCEYGYLDPYLGEFDCEIEMATTCENCKYLACLECKGKTEDE